jgi:hypothetical protein
MELIERLNKMGKVVNRRFPYVNNGGCCVFAAIVGQILVQKGIPVKGIVAAWRASLDDTKPIYEIRKRVQSNLVEDWERHGLCFSHVGLEFKHDGQKWHYHSKGAQKAGKEFDNMPVFRGRLTVDEMAELAGTDNGWNPTFDRNEIPRMYSVIKLALRDVTVVDTVPA